MSSLPTAGSATRVAVNTQASVVVSSLSRAELPPAPTARAAVVQAIEDLHARTCAEGGDGYMDPTTGFFVFSALSHLRRGKCCGSACRHCPFDWQKVSAAKIERAKAEANR